MLCTYLQAPIAASAAACALASSSSHQIYLITFCHAMADPNESRAAWRRHGVGSGEWGGRPTHSDSQRGRRTPQCKPRTFGGVPITKSRTMKTKKRRFVEMYYTEDTEREAVHSAWGMSLQSLIAGRRKLCGRFNYHWTNASLAWIRNVLSCVKWFQPLDIRIWEAETSTRKTLITIVRKTHVKCMN